MLTLSILPGALESRGLGRIARTAICRSDATSELAALARVAVRALHEELCLFPKPGLVSPRDSGSHEDMDAALMWRAICALRHGFCQLARAGARGDSFGQMRALGKAMESRMSHATRGVNTHRGAIFHLGLLIATAASGNTDVEAAPSGAIDPTRALLSAVKERWSAAILATAPPSQDHRPMQASPLSHGERARRLYGAGGARRQAAAGYPTVRHTALPVFRDALARLGGAREEIPAARRRALVQTLFALIATVEDTNLLHRAGPAGLAHARAAAQSFLDAGGVFTADWEARAVAIHRDFCRRRLSPGGSADLLAITIFAEDLAARQTSFISGG